MVFIFGCLFIELIHTSGCIFGRNPSLSNSLVR